MSGMPLPHIIFFILASFITFCVSEDVLGCGGYVRSDVEINFAQVGIKLFTKQGNLKYETECAPNDGYYFIPLYDKGSYIIKVAPPPGWSFSPEEVSLKVDGETDSCTLQKDINFHFKGFAVVGKVVSAGSDVGPTGVSVSLLRGDAVIQTTETSEGGDYVFTPLPAGKYTVVASHDKWTLLEDKVEVEVADQNGDAGSSLVVAGYSLTGSVTTDGQPTPGVSFILHAQTETQEIAGCTAGAPSGYKNNGQLVVVCHVNSDDSGVFNFNTVPTGIYSLTPFFQSEDTKYEVIPTDHQVTIANADVVLEKPFKVEGFSISGGVVNVIGGEALEDATVVLDGLLKTKTDSKGAFVFHNVKSGPHKIKVTADKYEFEESRVVISPQSTVLPPLAPARYQVCFSITLEKAASYSGPWSIAVSSPDSEVTVDLTSAGQGCVFLTPAKYKANVKLSPEADAAGMRFGPLEHAFDVVSEPISELAFSQFLGEISGEVACLETCPEIKLSLKSPQGGTPRTTTAVDGKFTFTEVVPGSYQLTVQKEEWCWEKKNLPVTVNTANVEVSLKHIGYQLTLASSHETTLGYHTNGSEPGTLTAQKGTTQVCISKPGVYTLTPIGCHKFSNSPVQWDTSAPGLVSLAATHHQLTGSIRTTESAPFSVSVKSGSDVTTLGPLNPSPEDALLYVFEHWVKEGEAVTLTPESPSNLYQYKPATHSLTMPSQCVLSSVEFKAERALFIHGRVNPKIAGVTITVEGGGNSYTYATDEEGQYTAGPLDNAVKFTVNAEKKGYVLNDLPEKGHFEAYKLAEVSVSIKDENGLPLAGVLVSMSGGKSYRQNSLTDKDGIIAFGSLNPGDYFLRPMMKEYNFEPASKRVQVLEGATLEVSISGVRTAYSVYGQTVSLSGEAETDVVVEAVGEASAEVEECSQYQEEAVSDNHGQFRIRGLLPKCKYVLRLKAGTPGIKQYGYRTLPAIQIIHTDNQDVENLKLLLIRKFNQLDVTAKVDVDPQYLSSLTAILYLEDLPDSPVHTIKLGTHPFFLLPPLTANGKAYFLRITSNLPKSQYQYNSPEANFVANTSFLHLSLSFEAKVNSIEAEMNQGTVMGLIVAILFIIIAANFQKFGPMLGQLSEMLSSISVPRPSSPTNSSQPETTEHAYIEPIKKKVKSRKI